MRAAATPAKSKRLLAGCRICPRWGLRLVRKRGGQPQTAPPATIPLAVSDSPSRNFPPSRVFSTETDWTGVTNAQANVIHEQREQTPPVVEIKSDVIN
jgi:hypothetical protein